MLGHCHWITGGKPMLKIRNVSSQHRTACIFLLNESIFGPIVSVLYNDLYLAILGCISFALYTDEFIPEYGIINYA